MNRKEFPHDKIEGIDVDIETSLKEYGIAWIKGEKETLFYYGIGYNGQDFNRFDFCTLDNDLDVRKEYDWAEWSGLFSSMDVDEKEWNNFPLEQKIYDLMGYHGWENVFGSCYYEGLKYSDIVKGDFPE